jgi:DNA-binding response OmpR family regulator
VGVSTPVPLRVAVVEDDDALRDVLFAVLEDEPGLELRCFATGAAALGLAEDVDVAVIDLRLPDVSGMDLVSHFVDRNTRVIVLTATSEQVEEAVARGAHQCLEKPFDIDELAHAVLLGSSVPLAV